MANETNLTNNTYPNEIALKELVKMMKRKDKITVSFVVDKYGYASTKLDSRALSEPFILQMSHEIYNWLTDYLIKGELVQPIPDAHSDLLLSATEDSNELATNTLISFLRRPENRNFMHVTPEVSDKPNKLTVMFGFPFGLVVFKVKREQKILEELASFDF